MSVASVCKRTISIERAPHVGEVSANFSGLEGVVWSARRIPMAGSPDFLDPEPLLFHSGSYSVILTRLSGTRSTTTTSKKKKSHSPENQTRDIWICSQELWPLDQRGGPPVHIRVQWSIKCTHSVNTFLILMFSKSPKLTGDMSFLHPYYRSNLRYWRNFSSRSRLAQLLWSTLLFSCVTTSLNFKSELAFVLAVFVDTNWIFQNLPCYRRDISRTYFNLLRI
jgi:hypothetical protein